MRPTDIDRDRANRPGRTTGTWRSNVTFGSRIGRLIVIQVAERRSGKSGGRDRIYWHCKCDCGMEVSVLQSDLRSGKAKSCGKLSCKRLAEQKRPEVRYEG